MVKGYWLCRLALLTTLSLSAIVVPAIAQAGVPLKRAVIASLRNAVELNLLNQAPRSANIRDTLAPGDALLTAQAARAELHFDDGSLARVGGQALFRFEAESRTLQLLNGTLLVLVPPNRGQTRIQTPNAIANVPGSALFVRYLPATNVTLVGALTESGIEITNRDRSQMQTLQAGQIAVVANNRIEQVYRFDLKTFYDTSELVKGLNLQCMAANDRTETDPAIAAVRAETAEAANPQALPGSCSENTAATDQPPVAAKAPVINQSTPTATTSVEQQAEPSAIAPPADRLLTPSTVTMPATFPPTIALPTTIPLANPPATGSTPPRPTEPPGFKGISSGSVGAPPVPNGPPPASTGTPSASGDLSPVQAGSLPGQTP
ncbi:MAG: FecR domain-containing protein [Stenomitos rutilans HA7619-LM2]|jgi:hypothetical protein|nr:FecR domain-containing protein [Stenomitos rutilans HA7619-LM2]